MIVAVIGANGQLGADVVATFQEAGEVTAGLTHADLDISSLEQTRNALGILRPSVVVNTAAMHHVENCEKEPQHAYDVNARGAQNLSIVARELAAKLVHVSTDYVFNGSKKTPYVESDPAAPLNVYGSTKLAGKLSSGKLTTSTSSFVRQRCMAAIPAEPRGAETLWI